MKRLVVVGNGMAGMACLEQILAYGAQFHVTVFGDETHVNYNRIMLSSVLAGEKTADDIVLNPLDWYRRHGVELKKLFDRAHPGHAVADDNQASHRSPRARSRRTADCL